MTSGVGSKVQVDKDARAAAEQGGTGGIKAAELFRLV